MVLPLLFLSLIPLPSIAAPTQPPHFVLGSLLWLSASPWRIETPAASLFCIIEWLRFSLRNGFHIVHFPRQVCFLMSPFLVEHVLSFPQEVRVFTSQASLTWVTCSVSLWDLPKASTTAGTAYSQSVYVILISHALSYFLTLAYFPSTKNSLSLRHMACLLMFQSLSA